MNRIIILNTLLLIFLSSCFKQDTPQVNSDYSPIGRDADRLESCTRVDFSNGFLKKNNIVDLFGCTQWNRKFPSLIQAIRNIDEQKWNTLMEPLSETFFDDKQRRDRVIRELRKLDDKGALESLSRVLTALNETNFYDAFNDLFVCSTDPSAEKCKSRTAGVATMERVEGLLDFLNRDENFFYHLASLFSRTVDAVKDDANEFRDEVRSFYETSAFTRLRIEFLDNAMKSSSAGISKNTKELLSKLFKEEAINGHGPFMFEWIQNPSLNETLFNDFLKYPILTRPQITKDLLVLLVAIEGGLSCKPYSGNNYLELDVAEEMTGLLQALSVFDHGRFIFYLMEKVSLLSSAEVFCDQVRRYTANIPSKRRSDFVTLIPHEINLIELVGETASFVSEPIYFDLMSFITKISTINEVVTPYALELLTTNTALSGLEILKLIDEKSKNYFDIVLKVSKRLPLEGYENLAEILSLVNDDSFIHSLESLGKLWDFYSQEEKNFLFKIVDRHMDEETDFISLFEFYSELLYEFVTPSQVFRERWYGSDQAKRHFYHSVESFVGEMSGDAVLGDFKEFFSRDHIIEIIKVVTQGVSLTEQRRADYNYDYMTYYSSVSESRNYSLDLRRGDPRTMTALNCIRDLVNLDRPFYEAIRSLPLDCGKLKDSSAIMTSFFWLNQTGDLYDRLYGEGQKENLFSELGMFSPRMINATAANLKILDEVKNGGMRSVFASTKKHLLTFERSDGTKGYLNEFVGLAVGLNEIMSSEHFNSQKMRNVLLNKLMSQENDRIIGFTKASINIMADFGMFLETNPEQVPKISSQRFRFSCNDFINQNIGYTCPESYRDVLAGINKLIPYLSKSYDGNTTFLGNLALAAASDKGFPIPLNSSNAIPYRMTMKETLKMQYDLSDPSRQINKSLVKFESKSGLTKKEKMSVLERIEVVIRDVKFRLNYLGVQYQNAVTQGDDYNEDVNSRKKLMERCIKIPVVRCGKKMSDEEKRKASNALEAYDGLADVNNGRGLDSGLRYGNYMKAMVSAVVASSEKKSQKVRLFPLGEDLLKNHNGILLAYVTEMAAFSHIGRWVHNRFAPSDEEFNKFLSSPDIAQIDRAFLLGINNTELFSVMKEISENLNKDSGRDFVSDVVKWFAERDNNALDLSERTLGRIFVLASLVGPEEIILRSREREFPQFEENTSLAFFKILNLVIKNWSTIKSNLSIPIDFEESIKELFLFVDFLYEKNSSGGVNKKEVYHVINELASMLTYFIETDYSIDELPSVEKFSGLAYIDSLLKEQRFDLVLNSTRGMYVYLEDMKKLNKGWHRDFGKTIDKYIDDPRSSLDAVKDYIYFTSLKNLCDEEDCEENPHYDEVYKMLNMAVSKNENEEFYLAQSLEGLFDREYQNFDELLRILMNALSVKVVEQ